MSDLWYVKDFINEGGGNISLDVDGQCQSIRATL